MAGPKKSKGEAGVYRFKIDAFTPQTIPMSRLAQYMAELAVLLGERHSVHFMKLTRGSAVLNAKIDHEAVPKVRDRVAVVRAGGSGEPMKAFNSLNKMLREDNATGVGVFRDDSPGGVVLHFPGREIAEEKFATIRQHGSIDGIVTGIRGKDTTIHITIQSEGQQISGCETNRSIAKQIGARLFEPVRLFGRGRWARDADGTWTLVHFKVESFEALEDATLGNALAALREIETEWGDEEYAQLIAARSGVRKTPNGGH